MHDREAGEHRRAVVDHRARDPQPDRRGQEPGAADGRGSARRSRTSSTPRSRSTSSTASSAASRTCSSTPRRRTTRFAPVNLADGGRLGADPDARQARRGARCAVARNYIAGPTVLADAEKLRQVFANILDNAIDALDAVAEDRRIELLHRERRPAGHACASATTAAASRRTRSSASSTRSSPPRRRAPASAWRSRRRSSRRTRAPIDVVSEPGRGTEFLVVAAAAAR